MTDTTKPIDVFGQQVADFRNAVAEHAQQESDPELAEIVTRFDEAEDARPAIAPAPDPAGLAEALERDADEYASLVEDFPYMHHNAVARMQFMEIKARAALAKFRGEA